MINGTGGVMVEILSDLPSTSYEVLYVFQNVSDLSRGIQASPLGSSGGFGIPSLNFTVTFDEPPVRLMHKVARVVSNDLFDGHTHYTRVMGVTPNWDGTVSLTTYDTQQAFDHDFYFPPFVGNISEWVSQVNEVATGVSSAGLLDIHADLTGFPLSLPSYRGNGWAWISMVCQANRWELMYDPGALAAVIAPVGAETYHGFTEVVSPNTSNLSYPLTTDSPAKTVEVEWYENEYITGDEVFPVRGEEPTILTIDSGAEEDFEVQTNVHLMSVNQPTLTDWVEADLNYYDGTNGVYAVAGNDGLPITPSQWTAKGGRLSVRIKEDDPTILVVHIKGMTSKTLGPFRISMTAGTGDYYNALRVTGTGVRQVTHTQVCPTGSDPAMGNVEVGETVSNPAISTREQARLVGVEVARRYTGINQEISGNMKRSQPYGLFVGPPDGGIDPLPGLLYRHRDTYYRIVNASYSLSGAPSFSASAFDPMSKFSSIWDDDTATMAEFMDTWDGLSMAEFMTNANRRDA